MTQPIEQPSSQFSVCADYAIDTNERYLDTLERRPSLEFMLSRCYSMLYKFFRESCI